ncbi:MAG: NAD(+)/NADH kinase [Candidatus Omnitrophica bacterium]|nr:NAD(+)/NADH kinase [Candidatus Omnitrophota bacterium]MCA9432097.1 NAD(+)/NADH kinase [Candidatus Omnitrophota bacterium]MCB9770528.1 NAD(+)/NADH kinase [Candidatus Omnitrophota bacterium]MCB9782521.1 NAD(+)/NADH kinase [Candidatus Omnitrophota bacterium]
MKVALVGRDLDEVEPLVAEYGFVIDQDSPEVVISNGGDGALLGAERLYPGIPKLGLRNSKTSTRHRDTDAQMVLQRLVEGTLREQRFLKLEAEVKGRKLIALNDIIIHNKILSSAVRYEVEIDGRNHMGEIVGDGLIVATPFGSSAYYRSITHSIFQVGIGLAFNNSIEPVNHLVLKETCEIEATILRGPAQAAADNDPEWVELDAGDKIKVRKSECFARILSIETLRGDQFHLINHTGG